MSQDIFKQRIEDENIEDTTTKDSLFRFFCDQELEESHGHELIDQIVKISRNPHIQRFYIIINGVS